MGIVTMYLLVLLVQGTGTVGLSFGTLEECDKARGEIIIQPDVLALSECVRVQLTAPSKKGTVDAR